MTVVIIKIQPFQNGQFICRYSRRDVTAVGNFTLNLSNVPRNSEYSEMFNKLLQTLLTKVNK